MKQLIEVDQLSYRHLQSDPASAPILRNVSFSVAEGEFVALIGANGSGKTTLARHLNALIQPTSGSVRIDGLDTRDLSSYPQIRSTIGMVFQHPEDQIVATLVEEDVAFGLENLCLLPKEIRAQVDKSLEAVKMSEQRLREPHLLSAGQMQRVALAGVLAMQSRGVIFDETTAMLDPAGRRDVLKSMAELNRMGITVLFITHNMDEVLFTRRVLLLDKGSLAFDGTPAELFAQPELVRANELELPHIFQIRNCFAETFGTKAPDWLQPGATLQSLLDQIPQACRGMGTSPATDSLPPSASENEVEIDGLSFTYGLKGALAHVSLEDVALRVQKGRAHGVAGATGSGKSTLLQHFNAIYCPQKGRMRVGGFDLNDPALDVQALRRYAGLVFQNPELYFFKQYVGDEIAFGPRQVMGKAGLRERVQWAMEMVGLDFERFKDRVCSTLSGGEQRKVALAAALANNPALLLLDEPTAGLDPASRRKLLRNLNAFRKTGMQLVITSHNMDDLAEIAENLTVLAKGKALATLPMHQAFLDRTLLKNAGLEQPVSVRFAEALRKKNWAIPVDCVKMSEVINWLKQTAKEQAAKEQSAKEQSE